MILNGDKECSKRPAAVEEDELRKGKIGKSRGK